MRIAVCDDEEKDRMKLCGYLKRYISEHPELDYDVDVYENGKVLIKKYWEETHPYDVLLLDVEMNYVDGMQVAKAVREVPDYDVLIMFISSYPEYMQSSFDVQAAHFLQKPLQYNVFSEKLNLILNVKKNRDKKIVLELGDGKEQAFKVRDIICVETEKSFTQKYNLNLTYIVNGENHTERIKGKLSELEKKLDSPCFIKSHRSTIVNMRYIKIIEKERVILEGNKTVELSRRINTEFRKKFNDYISEV